MSIWLGHTSTATHYVSEDIEFHRAQYAKGYPSIQLDLTQDNIIEELKKKDREISQLKEEMEKLKPLIDFANAFRDPVSLQFFLDTFRKADGIKLPPTQGTFYKVEFDDKAAAYIEATMKKTGKSSEEVINEMLKKGIKDLSKLDI